MQILNLLTFVTGVALVIWTIFSAIRTFVLPRGEQDTLTRIVFLTTRFVFYAAIRPLKTYAPRDRVLAYYAPVSLLALPPTWLMLVCLGYTAIYKSLGAPTWYEAFRASGSSLLTLGFETVNDPLKTILVFSEATIGLILVALLISYLPTMYAAFSRRESKVALLEVRAGSPPSPVEMILRFHRQRGLQRLSDFWEIWEEWFADLEESHTSLAALVFLRSPQSDHSWVTAAGVVLDSAALILSTIDIPYEPQAAYCIRAGFIALRRIADFFYFPYDAHPKPDDPISITRAEYDAVYNELSRAGLPIHADHDKAWRDFSGWRVNYDSVLLALADLTVAPYAMWSSDRAHGRAQIRKRRVGGLPIPK